MHETVFDKAVGFHEPRSLRPQLCGNGTPQVGWVELGSDAKGWQRVGMVIFDGTGKKTSVVVDGDFIADVSLRRVRDLQESGAADARISREQLLAITVRRVLDQIADLVDFQTLAEYPQHFPHTGELMLRAAPAVGVRDVNVTEVRALFRETLALVRE